MIIREIELNNFRIYNGTQKVDLTSSDGKNIVIVSGENGFGKTTFLMAIVWCLYGKQMASVDELYKTEIGSKHGYTGYMISCLNKYAKSKGITNFSVTLSITDLELPDDVRCNEIKIKRSFDIMDTSGDDLVILFDGKLIDEVFPSVPKEKRIESEEYFIRERIMPIEIAKFFFFDAERIVTYAQMDSTEQQKSLADAYSQVLGIQKYLDLKDTLSAIREGYKKEGIRSKELEEYNNIKASIDNNEAKVRNLSEEIETLEVDYEHKKYESGQLQERLLREGNTMTQEELCRLKEEQQKYKDEIDNSQEGLKELYAYIPFGLSGDLFAQLIEQVRREQDYKQKKVQIEIAEDRTNELLNDLDEVSHEAEFAIDRKIRRFYEETIKMLIKKHFYSDVENEEYANFNNIHNLSEVQTSSLISLVSKVKTAKSELTRLYDIYSKANREHYSIEQRIREAEAQAENPIAKKLRADKSILDSELEQIIYNKGQRSQEIAYLNQQISSDKKRKETLLKKIEVSDKFKEKDRAITHVINTIERFLLCFKAEKKRSLEKRILSNLKSLLHKNDLIAEVEVYMQSDLVDIIMHDKENRRLEPSDLSMGERQMFSTALLGALVEETGLTFPVFIDSPMQKFDRSHSKNILQKFYPKVSKQVVLFPLLHKELTPSEYELIKDRTEKVIIIENKEHGSMFNTSINKNELFNY